jgi:hypothetical protein
MLEIAGRPARLPEDLDTIVDARAMIRRLDLLQPDGRAQRLDGTVPPDDLPPENATMKRRISQTGPSFFVA